MYVDKPDTICIPRFCILYLSTIDSDCNMDGKIDSCKAGPVLFALWSEVTTKAFVDLQMIKQRINKYSLKAKLLDESKVMF